MSSSGHGHGGKQLRLAVSPTRKRQLRRSGMGRHVDMTMLGLIAAWIGVKHGMVAPDVDDGRAAIGPRSGIWT